MTYMCIHKYIQRLYELPYIEDNAFINVQRIIKKRFLKKLFGH